MGVWLPLSLLFAKNADPWGLSKQQHTHSSGSVSTLCCMTIEDQRGISDNVQQWWCLDTIWTSSINTICISWKGVKVLSLFLEKERGSFSFK